MRTTKRTTIALSTVAALLVTGGAATAVAASDGDAAQGTSATSAVAAEKAEKGEKSEKPKRDGARKLCKRAPKIDKRIDRVLRRLDGKAAKRGSVARLEQRIENAKKAGHGPIADYLANRLEDRKAVAPRLKDRQKDLDKVRTWCEDNNNGRGKESKR
ncbi:MAG: hypothetical protein ACRDP3_11650 [Streptomyces sp.]|uniref:hypothetical protein n=1 Tax=Streptomyces sp. TaxID=1931 RepID=UPI003D6BCC7F